MSKQTMKASREHDAGTTSVQAVQTSDPEKWELKISGPRVGTSKTGTIILSRRGEGWVLVMPTPSPVLTVADFENLVSMLRIVERPATAFC